jgi:hypothetical protein
MTTPLVRDLRRITAARATARPPRPVERCDLCTTEVPPDHRHLLQLEERQILCACESCFALRSGEPQFRPTGNRVLWLEDFELADDVWAEFGIPIGLAFLFRSTVAQQVVALYPSPAGATESELELDSWSRLVEANPVLETLAADSEALIVNRLADPGQFAIAPIDRCYALVGLVKLRWEGINGGRGLADAVSEYFDALRADAA